MDVETDERQGHAAPTEPELERRVGGRTGAVGGTTARRAQVIAATMRLIARDGVAALSTRKIAREADVNLATLHYLFGRKDDLLVAVLDAATSAIIATLVAVDGHPGGGLRMALQESVATLCALLDQEPALPLVRCEVLLYARGRPMQVAATHQQQRYLDALAICFRVAGAPGEVGLLPSEDLAAVVSSSIDGLVLQTATGVPLAQQVATRAQVLCALLALAPGPAAGLQACADGGDAARSVRLFEDAIRSARTQ